MLINKTNNIWKKNKLKYIITLLILNHILLINDF